MSEFKIEQNIWFVYEDSSNYQIYFSTASLSYNTIILKVFVQRIV